MESNQQAETWFCVESSGSCEASAKRWPPKKRGSTSVFVLICGVCACVMPDSDWESRTAAGFYSKSWCLCPEVLKELFESTQATFIYLSIWVGLYVYSPNQIDGRWIGIYIFCSTNLSVYLFVTKNLTRLRCSPQSVKNRNAPRWISHFIFPFHTHLEMPAHWAVLRRQSFRVPCHKRRLPWNIKTLSWKDNPVFRRSTYGTICLVLLSLRL